MALGTTLTDLSNARTEVHTIATAVEDEQRTLHDSMTSFLESGWTGPAAHDFATGWREWNAAAAKVLAGLHAIGDLLADVRVDFATTDDGSRSNMVHLTARLGPQ